MEARMITYYDEDAKEINKEEWEKLKETFGSKPINNLDGDDGGYINRLSKHFGEHEDD
jgi:hypothetical protein